MSIATILWRGPERTFAEKLASMQLNTHVETYTEKPEFDPMVMHQSYQDRSGLGSISYVEKVARRTTVYKEFFHESSFALSEQPTSYRLVDEWFVVYLITPGQEKPRARVQQLDHSRENEITLRHVTAFDHLAQPGSAVDRTRKIFESMTLSFRFKLAFTFAG